MMMFLEHALINPLQLYIGSIPAKTKKEDLKKLFPTSVDISIPSHGKGSG